MISHTSRARRAGCRRRRYGVERVMAKARSARTRAGVRATFWINDSVASPCMPRELQAGRSVLRVVILVPLPRAFYTGRGGRNSCRGLTTNSCRGPKLWPRRANTLAAAEALAAALTILWPRAAVTRADLTITRMGDNSGSPRESVSHGAYVSVVFDS